MEENKKTEKLGYAFLFGMEHLTFGQKDDSNKALRNNLFASFAYMLLHGLINKNHMNFILSKMELADEPLDDFESPLAIIQFMVNYFKKKDLSDLVELLDNYSIPEWFFKHGWNILQSRGADMVFDGNHLYCIDHKNENDPVFLRFNLDLVDPLADMDTKKDFYEPGYGWSEINRNYYIKNYFNPEHHTDNLYNRGIDELGYGYSKILCYDCINEYIFLKSVDNKNIIYGYDIHKVCFFRTDLSLTYLKMVCASRPFV